jgi:hypothetical protein
MEELVWLAIVGLFKLFGWILKKTFRGLGRLLSLGGRRAAPVRSAPPRASAPAPTPRSAPSRKAPTGRAAQLVGELGDVQTEANALAERVRGELENAPFAETLVQLARRAGALRQRLASGEAVAPREAESLLERFSVLLEIVSTMAAQRRDPELADLLGDADALAAACYAPIVEYCRRKDIRLTSDRTATAIGGDKLFLLSVDDPAGLAAIVLPEAWASDLGWWPALAHEIGHDFYNSVTGLPRELMAALELPAQKDLPRVANRLTTADLDRAISAWHEELFADAFGTMMLGPAYVRTMSAIFASPAQPARACTIDFEGGRYEEHPPGHVRVACGARLLRQMGYGKEGDDLEAAWRRRHANPDRLLVPSTAGAWMAVDDEAVISRALNVGSLLYETGLSTLGGMPLRSIAGLDFGPREHARAHDVKSSLLAGVRPALRDPRLLIAGGVLAWFERPDQSARVYRLTREAVTGVGTKRRSVPGAATRDAGADDAFSPALLRDAILLDALLAPPRCSRVRR